MYIINVFCIYPASFPLLREVLMIIFAIIPINGPLYIIINGFHTLFYTILSVTNTKISILLPYTYHASISEGTVKTQNPKCRLHLC
jgi:hypothetical protein